MKNVLLALLVLLAYGVFAQEKTSITNNVDYDGVYIELGQGKYAELKGASVGYYKYFSRFNISNKRFLQLTQDLKPLATVSKATKVIFKGENFNTAMSRCYISPVQEFKTLNIHQARWPYTHRRGTTVKEKNDAYTQKRSDQGSVSTIITIDFKKRKVADAHHEILITEELDTNKPYVIWFKDSIAFYYFQIKK